MQLHFSGAAMTRKHSSFVLAGHCAAAAFKGSSLTCRADVVDVEVQPALNANTEI